MNNRRRRIAKAKRKLNVLVEQTCSPVPARRDEHYRRIGRLCIHIRPLSRV